MDAELRRGPGSPETVLPRLIPLPGPDALPLLASLGTGRLTHASPGPRSLLVLRHLVEDGQVILRVRLLSALSGPPVYPMRLTYQADRIDPDDHTGPTAIVTGPAERITEPAQQARYRIPMRAWPDETGEHLLRLRPDTVTAYHLTRDQH
jgi:hypothetical protein